MTMRTVVGGVLLVLTSVTARAEMSGHEPHDHDAVAVITPAVATAIGDGDDHAGHDHMRPYPFLWAKLDQLERRASDGEDALAWEGAISWGGSFDRLWLRTEGERAQGRTEEQEAQLYWSHAVGRWWESILGLRQDTAEGPARRWLAVGVQGLAPYWFELAATAYVGESGRTALRLEGDYEVLLSNRLILQPELELDFYGQDDVAHRRGQGLSESVVGLRLRYEIRREFAPYVGLRWQRQYGDTADMARAAGAQVGEAQLLAGVRAWF